MKAVITITAAEGVELDAFQKLADSAFTAARSRFGDKATGEVVVRSGARVSAGAGGGKGEAVLTALKEHPEWTRRQVAEHAGCALSRVGEVMRAAGIERPRAVKEAKPVAEKPAKKAAADKPAAKRAPRAAKPTNPAAHPAPTEGAESTEAAAE